MTPKEFSALAVAAVVSSVVAIAVYSSSVEWSRSAQGGEALFPRLPDELDRVAAIEVKQGGERIVLTREGTTWVLEEHDSFPAAEEKAQALLTGLSTAELVEAKTRKQDLYALLGVEDPAATDAGSRLVRLTDKNGEAIAEVIVGNKRLDPSGVGQSGSYVRKPDETQAWLSDKILDAGVTFEDWANPQLFDARREDVKHLTVHIPGEEPLEIERDETKRGHTLADLPDGKKLKYLNIVDEIVRAASSIHFSDVRKRQSSSGGSGSKVVLELEGGLTATYFIREDGDDTWLSLEATAEGAAKTVADNMNVRAKGWEFRVPRSWVKEILKRREELLEEVSS